MFARSSFQKIKEKKGVLLRHCSTKTGGKGGRGQETKKLDRGSSRKSYLGSSNRGGSETTKEEKHTAMR